MVLAFHHSDMATATAVVNTAMAPTAGRSSGTPRVRNECVRAAGATNACLLKAVVDERRPHGLWSLFGSAVGTKPTEATEGAEPTDAARRTADHEDYD